MECLPGKGSNNTFQSQGVASNISRVFAGVVAGESKTTLSDGQVGLPYGLVSQVGLILAHDGIVGYLPLGLVALPRQLRHQI